MAKSIKFLGFIFQAAIAGLALAFIVIYFWPSLVERLNSTPEPVVSEQPATPFSYAEAVNRAAPAVVSIYTQSLMPQSMDPDLKGEKAFRYL